jgi:hypothetical protein
MATSAKAPAKPASKIPVKAPAAKKAATPAKATMAALEDKSPKTDKAKKPKLVRDSFTIPKAEYAVLEALKERAAKAGAPSKKSELLRAGIKALAGMPEAAFLAAMGAVPAIKTGRPAKH